MYLHTRYCTFYMSVGIVTCQCLYFNVGVHVRSYMSVYRVTYHVSVLIYMLMYIVTCQCTQFHVSVHSYVTVYIVTCQCTHLHVFIHILHASVHSCMLTYMYIFISQCTYHTCHCAYLPVSLHSYIPLSIFTCMCT